MNLPDLFGITTPLSQGLAVALGGSEVNAMELVNAHATIADQGRGPRRLNLFERRWI